MSDAMIAKLSHELEDAGALGLSAAGFLAMFAAAEGKPGVVSSTSIGLVWTKTMETIAAEQEFPFGVGKLKIEGGLFSCTAGVHIEDDRFTHIDILVSFFQAAGGASKVYLELDRDIAVLADKDIQSGVLVGYRNTGQPARIELPLNGALEFSFRVTPEGQLLSSVQVYEDLSGVAEIASGILELSLDGKVLVLPWLCNVGLTLDRFFLDLSASGASDFAAKFPEAYDPSWKGIGATEVGLLIPVDTNEFVIATIEGFLYGLDGRFSMKAELNYINNEPGRFVRRLGGSFEIRHDDLIRSDLTAILDLNKSVNRVQTQSTAAGFAPGTPASSTALAGRARTNTADGASGLAFSGQLRCKVGLARAELDGLSAWGLDISVEAIDLAGGDSGLAISGTPAHVIYWLLGGAAGTALLVDGHENDDSGKIAGGVATLFLILCDIGAFSEGNAFIPRLSRLTFTRLGYRYVSISQEGDVRHLHQVLLDIRTRFDVDGALIELLNRIASLVITVADSPAKLFGEEANDLQIKGPLDLAFRNIPLTFQVSSAGTEFNPDIDARLRHLFDIRDFAVEAKELPEIVVQAGASADDTSSNWPKPVVGFQFVQREKGGEQHYGFALHIKGITHSAVSLATPAVGIVVYVFPEFAIEFSPQVVIEPKFVFMIPGVVYAEGVIDLNKPIPSFDGTQNRISVDIGIISTAVPAGGKIDKDKLKQLADLTKYQWRAGGEVAWGEVGLNNPDPRRHFDFLFIEASIESKSVIFPIGPVGIFGFGGLFGRNIAPGVPGGDRSASGIARWIQSGGGSGSSSFSKVRNWPDAPAPAEWHPARDFDDDSDLYAIGLYVKAGSTDGETVIVDSILLVAFPEFLLALAGFAVIKPIGGKLAVVIVYDHPSKSFAIRAVLEYKIDESDGNIILVKAPFELGTGGGDFWIYLGHFLEAQGGPVTARIFEFLNVKAYYDFDTRDFNPFGLVATEGFDRPSIPGPAYGQGAMFQLGPKTYGPSFLNVRLFAAMGYNLAISFSPFLVFGELYAGGYIRIKVFIFKFKFSLSARLAGMAVIDIGDFKFLYRFEGEIAIRIGLPWPFDDINTSFDFFIEGGTADGIIPEPQIAVSPLGLQRLRNESMAFEPGVTPVLPIDAVISLQFDKPIFEVTSTPAAERTQLTINDEGLLDPDLRKETISTEFVGQSYTVTYRHVLENIRIRRRNIGGGDATQMMEIPASWEVPAMYVGGAPDERQQPHHVLYLNSLLPPELQFYRERLGTFYDSRAITGHVPPCQRPQEICLLQLDPLPDIKENPATGKQQAAFATDAGAARIVEERFLAHWFPSVPVNVNRLRWTNRELLLPYETEIRIPDSTRTVLRFRLETRINLQLLLGLRMRIVVQLRGQADPQAFTLDFLPDTNLACQLALKPETGDVDAGLLAVGAVVRRCVRPGQIEFTVQLDTAGAVHLIERITVYGPHFSLHTRIEQSHSQVLEMLKLITDLVASTRVLLVDCCFTQGQAEHGQWTRTEIAGDPADGNEAGIDAAWESQLLEPNQEYTIDYMLHSYATAESQRGSNSLEPKDFAKPVRTIRFRTEATPSQDVKQYLGFKFPDEQMQPLYPEGLAPLTTFKYDGLIKKIYHKHYGSDVLQPKVTDLDGNEIPRVLTQRIEIGSSPTDAALEDLLRACLPQAQDMTQLEVQVWDRSLETDTRYALFVEDSSTPASPRVLHPGSFQTSHYRNLAEHVQAVEALFPGLPQLPMLTPDDPQGLLNDLFTDIVNDPGLAFDAVVERAYRGLLGIDGGKVGDFLGSSGDFAGYIVARSGVGPTEVWGLLIELTEPILNKEGMQLRDVRPGTQALQERGLLLTRLGGQNRLVLRDRSGSRMLVFNSANALAFIELQNDTRLRLRFSLDEAVRVVIERYVARTLTYLSEAEQELQVTRTYNELNGIAEIADLLRTQNQSLTLPTL